MHGNNFFNKSSTVSFGEKTKITSVYFILKYTILKSHLISDEKMSQVVYVHVHSPLNSKLIFFFNKQPCCLVNSLNTPMIFKYSWTSISGTLIDISNKMDIKRWFVTPNYLFFMYFTLYISKLSNSPIEFKITKFDCTNYSGVDKPAKVLPNFLDHYKYM